MPFQGSYFFIVLNRPNSRGRMRARSGHRGKRNNRGSHSLTRRGRGRGGEGGWWGLVLGKIEW